MNAETHSAETGAEIWRRLARQIFDVLQEHDIRQVYHVPDAGHSRLIEHCQRSNSMRTVPLTTGRRALPSPRHWLAASARCCDAEFGRRQHHQPDGPHQDVALPLLTLITMRGDGAVQSWQYPMGQGTPKVLEAMGVLLYPVDKAAEVKATVDARRRAPFNGGRR
jgi:hypothetical protein